MILHTLTLQGVLAFPGTVTLDLDALPEGLIAVSGPNGSGKTSLLEAAFACLYRRFPSRAGALTDYATRRDAYMALTFTIPGKGRYRSVLRLDHVARSSSAVLEHIPDGDGAPRILNDGKVTTYDQVIADLLPPPELLLASAFAAQNRAGSFLQASRAERRALFARLLGLDHYERLAETAKAIKAEYDRTRDRLSAMRAVYETHDYASLLANALSVLATGQQTLDGLVTRGEELKAAMETAKAESAAAEASALSARHAQEAFARAQRDLSTLDLRKAGIDTQRKMAVQEWTVQTESSTAHLTTTLADLERRAENNRQLIARADATRQAAAAHEAAVAAHTEALARERALAPALQQARDEERALAVQVATLANDEAQAALLGDVPCHGEAPYAGCGFLAAAVQARQRLTTAASLRAAHAAAKDALVLSQATVEHARTEAEAARARLNPKALDLLAKLEAAETRMAEIAGEVDSAKTLHAEALVSATQRQEKALAEADDAEAVWFKDRAAAEQAYAAAKQRVDETSGAEERARLAQKTLSALGEAFAAWRYERQQAGEQVLAAQGNAKTAKDGLAAVERLDATDAGLVRDLAAWQIVIDACSRTGIPTLEMDAAGPTVASFTNDLLRACFGGRFSVDLITQDAKADGKGTKEVFEIRVYDAERNGAAVDIMDLSGGERVIVDEAVKCAIARLVNERASWPILTLWRDETTGALDPGNATRYVEMLRRLAQRAGVRHILFITHMPEAARQADAQIHVGGGRLRVAYPPYPQED